MAKIAFLTRLVEEFEYFFFNVFDIYVGKKVYWNVCKIV